MELDGTHTNKIRQCSRENDFGSDFLEQQRKTKKHKEEKSLRKLSKKEKDASQINTLWTAHEITRVVLSYCCGSVMKILIFDIY